MDTAVTELRYPPHARYVRTISKPPFHLLSNYGNVRIVLVIHMNTKTVTIYPNIVLRTKLDVHGPSSNYVVYTSRLKENSK